MLSAPHANIKPSSSSSRRRRKLDRAGSSGSADIADPPTGVSLPPDILLPITIGHILVPPTTLTPSHSPASLRYLRQRNSHVSKTTPLFSYYAGVRSLSSTNKGKGKASADDDEGPVLRIYDSPIEGQVLSWHIQEGQVLNNDGGWRTRAVVEIQEPCTHAVQWQGQCAICGKDLTAIDYTGVSEAARATIPISHSAVALTVSFSEATRLESESRRRLLKAKKLSLIVDLDQTIVHATVDPTVGEWMEDKNNPNWEALQGVAKFKLGDVNLPGLPPGIETDGCWYYLKLRPGLRDFLDHIAEMYEMHVYTMGTRAYAAAVCNVIDPSGDLFRGRILSRDESGSLTQKSIERLFPVDASMVAIIDDRLDVWDWSPNLVAVVPYNFFVGIGDINGAFLPPRQDALPVTSTEASPPAPDPNGDSKDKESTQSGSAGSEAPVVVTATPGITAPALTQAAQPTTTNASDGPINPADFQGPVEAVPSHSNPTMDAAVSSASKVISEQLTARPLKRRQEELDRKERRKASGSANGSSPPTPSSKSSTKSSEPATPRTNRVTQEEGKTPSTERMPVTPTVKVPNILGLESIESPSGDDDDSETEVDEDEDVWHGEKAVLVDRDDELKRVERVLTDVHNGFYGLGDPGSCDTREVINAVKMDVLSGVHVAFSGVWPMGQDPEEQEVWRLAKQFGATCHVTLVPHLTHLVAQQFGTAKVNAALKRPGVFVVHPAWLRKAIKVWQRPEEEPFTWVSGNATASSPILSTVDADADPDADEESAQREEISIDWEKADEEVMALLAETDDEADGTEYDRSVTGSPDDATRKRMRVPSASLLADKDERAIEIGTESPLSKRQRLARDRISRLKHRADTGDDAGEEANDHERPLQAGGDDDEDDDEDDVDFEAMAAELF